MSKDFLKRQLFGLLVFIGSTNLVYSQNDAANDPKPNIVLILVDDSGLMDFGIYGGEARTPNIDRLAGDGIMFTNMHASPVCSPSQAMLLTGTDSHLAGVANLPEFLPEEYQGIEGYGGVLNDRVQTIATRLKEANYHTYALGKWHLGHDENTLPSKRGFDRSFILGASGASNYDNKGYLPMKPVAHWYADGEETELPEDFYSSKTYIDKAISFHQEAENKDKLREDRFQKAKQLGLIPKDTKFTDALSKLKKWNELSTKEQDARSMSMAVTAGMLEAMDYHIGRIGSSRQFCLFSKWL
ncbi:MAG: sulfatase-like hydrolase/transferase [Bacteroidia bacterium]|nr:sulfatase-like hydrolase/transferase [Bacteroidia bacterium]